jgi:uncharacterized protein (DUF433 family)
VKHHANSNSTSALGSGVYRLSDVARYTHLKPARPRTWFADRRGRRVAPVFRPEHPGGGTIVVSFLDMVDAWMVGELRARGVSMPAIRAAHAALRAQLETAHPFAHVSIYTDGVRVFADAARHVADPVLTEVVSKQTFFPRVRECLTRIEYAPDSHLARRWNIATGVVIDPTVSFGQPVVRGTGVTTRVVASAFRANREDTGLVSDLFGITPQEVLDAVRFEDGHRRRDAA